MSHSAIFDSNAVRGDGPLFDVIDPATEEAIAAIPEAGPALVDRAVAAARTSFADRRWRGLDIEARQALLRRAADAIDAAADELAELESRNTGIPLSQIRGRQIGRAAYNFRFFADYIGQSTAELYEQSGDYLTFVRREPVGVAALISPWNAPIALGSMKVAAAIAFGNSCVLKPSEVAPLGISRLIELIQPILPEGVVNLLNGRGQTTGDALVRHQDVDLVSFTGGTRTGAHILSAAGARLKPATMELGGKSANIIFADADLDRAIDGALLGIFSNNGQQCLAGSRILVQRTVYDAFVAAFVARTKRIRIGHPADPATEIGPLASRQHMEHVLSFADEAGAGARLLAGGRRAAGFQQGFYVEPTVVAVDSNSHRICQEEIFGPFAALLPFDTAEDAWAIANDSRFGLACYVWTQSLSTAIAAQDAIAAGVVWINTPMMRELRAPFGGYRDSGIGAEGGRACEAFYTRQKTVTMPRRAVPLRRLGAD
jgi:acyl-CoA reductase-like NAD-dependent aldehyde dehydrogenase